MAVFGPHVAAAEEVLVLNVDEVLRSPDGCDVRLPMKQQSSQYLIYPDVTGRLLCLSFYSDIKVECAASV